MVIDGRELRAVKIALRGWAERRTVTSMPARAAYEGAVWVSPELGRPVRYEAKMRASGNLAAGFNVNEVTELVRIGRD
jgi:hypothetical protein